MPIEVHEHYDVDGNKTGQTVIQRESAWDDESRARALALAEYERGRCGCGCGLSARESHRKQPFVVNEGTCEAGRVLAQHRRAVAKAATKENRPDGWDDGTYYYITPLADQEGPHGDS